MSDTSCQQVALAELLVASGRPGDALRAAERALAANAGAPPAPRLLHTRARAQAALGDAAGAFVSLTTALAVAPDHVPSLLELAALYKAKGLLAEARGALERAIAVTQPQACKAAAAATDGGAAASASGALSAEGDAIAARDSGSAADARETGAAWACADGGRDGDRAREALATVLTDLGTAAKAAGRTGEALELYHAALGTWPALAAGHYNLGVLASEAGRERWPEALEHYRRALECCPTYAQALCNVGVIHKECGRLEEAVLAYERAMQAAPGYDLVRLNLAIALTDLGTLAKAGGDAAHSIALYERALALAPRHADALYNLGVALAEAGPHQALDRALYYYQAAAAAKPDCAEAYNNAGVIYRERNELERAADCFLAAINIRPNFPQSLNNLAVMYTSQGRSGEAAAMLQAATVAAPAYAEAWNNLGVVQRDIGAVADAVVSYERSAALAPEQHNAAQNRLLALNYAHPGEDPWVCEQHAAWGAAFEAGIPQLAPVSPRSRQRSTSGSPPGDGGDSRPAGSSGGSPCSSSGGRGSEGGGATAGGGDAGVRSLRIGYVSPDLFTHSVSYFAEAPLRHHDPAAVALFVYDCTPRRDVKSAALRAAAEARGAVWRCVEGASDAELAELVRCDRIDVLVELTGHTANNRLGVMARRPAPVQATWIGYPNSTGLAAIDYRITDAVADPDSTSQTFVERLVRLPGCFLCYTPPPDAPPVAPPPAGARGFVTFGSFNALAKITGGVLALWARVLAAVPGSRLVLKNKPFACAQTRALWAARLAAAGVEAWRVDLLPLAASNTEHLTQYSLLDVSLDPFPYAGTTTTVESLYMGVPCISLRGGCHAHNVGASLLTTVGLADWVVDSEDEYVARAVAAAADTPALAALRAGMRRRVMASPLCDGPGFVQRLEGVYSELFARWKAHPFGEQTACEAGGAVTLLHGQQRHQARVQEHVEQQQRGLEVQQQQQQQQPQVEHQRRQQPVQTHGEREPLGNGVLSDGGAANRSGSDDSSGSGRSSPGLFGRLGSDVDGGSSLSVERTAAAAPPRSSQRQAESQAGTGRFSRVGDACAHARLQGVKRTSVDN